MFPDNLRNELGRKWRRIGWYLFIGCLALGLLSVAVGASTAGSDTFSERADALTAVELNLSEDSDPSGDDADENLSAEANLTISWEPADDTDD